MLGNRALKTSIFAILKGERPDCDWIDNKRTTFNSGGFYISVLVGALSGRGACKCAATP